MKLSVAIAGKDAPDNAFVVWRGFEESTRKAAELGFHGIELALKEASEVDPTRLAALLSEHGLEASCVTTGQVCAVLGLYFTHPDSSVRARTLEVFKELINLASDFGQLVNIGRARGWYAEGQPREETEQLFIDTCRTLCDYAAPRNVTIMIEPVNRYEINFINSVVEGAELLDRVERDNLGLMPDVFHMNIEDIGIGKTLAAYIDRINYVHLADSNRLAPGQGHLDFDDVFAGLRRGNYDGWVSIEILPKPDPESAAEQAARTLLPMVERYNRGDDFM